MSLEIGRKITTDTGSHLVLTSSPMLFTSQAEMREQLLCLTRTAERQLTFWSRDLNSGLFKSASFLDVVKRFVLARRNAQVRILTLPFTEHTKLEHPLLLMAERMPLCFQIRTTDTCCLEAAELLMADERGVLYRIQADRWDGMANIYDPMVARFYRVQFDTAWNAAQSPVTLEQTASL
jgi:hypothetical protein